MKYFIAILAFGTMLLSSLSAVDKISITDSITVPLIINGKTSGSIKLPIGSSHKIKSLKENEVEILFSGSSVFVPKKCTDYEIKHLKEKEVLENEERKIKEKEKIINSEIQKNKEEQENAIGFKGLNLRFPISKFEEFIYSTQWSIKYIGWQVKSLDAGNQNQSMLLTSDGIIKYGDFVKYDNPKADFSSDQRNDFAAIGKSGDFWYNWNSVFVCFFDGKINRISVSGFDYDASYLKTRVREWLSFIEIGLTEKYGKPTHIIKPIDRAFCKTKKLTRSKWPRF